MSNLKLVEQNFSTTTTMTSVELFEMLKGAENGRELKTLHRDLKAMFSEEIKIGTEIVPIYLGANKERVEHYVLNEILSKMFVASKDKKYLRQITQFWIDKTAVKPKTQLEMLAEGFAKMAEVEKRQLITEQKVEQIQLTLEDMQISHEFFTITAYLKLNQLPDRDTAGCAKVGRAASKLCKESDIVPTKIAHGRWGTVQQYPHHIIKSALEAEIVF